MGRSPVLLLLLLLCLVQEEGSGEPPQAGHHDHRCLLRRPDSWGDLRGHSTVSCVTRGCAVNEEILTNISVSWVFSVVMLLMHINKHRAEAANQTQPSQPPPQYVPSGQQPDPMEKYGQATPQQQYAQPVQPPQGPQFVQPPQQAYTAPYPQDPIPRQDTVSPMSQTGYAPVNPNVSELGPQHTGGYSQVSELSTPGAAPYPPNVSELSTSQHTGATPYPNATELSTPQHTGPPAADLPELSNQK